MSRKKLLFVCEPDRIRSITAACILRQCQKNLEIRTASVGGLKIAATEPVTPELLEWADTVFVMERKHRNRIHKEFPDLYETTEIICLYIDNRYRYLDEDLVALIREKTKDYLEEG